MIRAPATGDLACVAVQLGRDPHPFRRVVARCPWGAPAVVEDLPYDAAGRPFPTLFWATCPALVAAVSALESAGGVRRFEALLADDDRLRGSLSAATRYERRRRRDLAARCEAPPRDGGASLATGIGGVARRQALKCLHCHAAHALARPQYLFGALILEAAAPLYSARACCTPGAPGGSTGGSPESPQ
jgi:uncharacterized protein